MLGLVQAIRPEPKRFKFICKVDVVILFGLIFLNIKKKGDLLDSSGGLLSLIGLFLEMMISLPTWDQKSFYQRHRFLLMTEASDTNVELMFLRSGLMH